MQCIQITWESNGITKKKEGENVIIKHEKKII